MTDQFKPYTEIILGMFKGDIGEKEFREAGVLLSTIDPELFLELVNKSPDVEPALVGQSDVSKSSYKERLESIATKLAVSEKCVEAVIVARRSDGNIAAIKEYRNRTSLNLKVSKEAVDIIESAFGEEIFRITAEEFKILRIYTF